MRDVLDELRAVLVDRPVIDGVLPVLAFGIAAAVWSVTVGAVAAVVVGIAAAIRRRIVGGPTSWAFGGLAGVALAAGFAVWSDSAGGFFVPGIARGAGVAVVGLVSLVMPLPMVAWTSKVFRRWPTDWYRHRAVRPAYVETTLLWVAFFAGRAWAQWAAIEASSATQAVLAVLLGWPATIVLLVVTYVYGRWRLVRLAGPSVEEFIGGAPPPWSGQERGF